MIRDLEELEAPEYKLLCMAIDNAVRLAADGRFSEGYQCLLSGLERARDFAAAGEPWARDLEQEYRRALRHYEKMLKDRHLTLRDLFEPTAPPTL